MMELNLILDIGRRISSPCLISVVRNRPAGENMYKGGFSDEEKMCCSVYDKRCELVPACLKLSPDNVDKLAWMPKTCAYRELFENRPSAARTTVKGRVISETGVPERTNRMPNRPSGHHIGTTATSA